MPILGKVFVCLSCCCGNQVSGRPEVPAEWLIEVWQDLGIQDLIPLKISSCLGVCQKANVVLLRAPQCDVWLGGLDCQEDYQNLFLWAAHSAQVNRLLPLPEHLWPGVFEPSLLA